MVSKENFEIMESSWSHSRHSRIRCLHKTAEVWFSPQIVTQWAIFFDDMRLNIQDGDCILHLISILIESNIYYGIARCSLECRILRDFGMSNAVNFERNAQRNLNVWERTYLTQSYKS